MCRKTPELDGVAGSPKMLNGLSHAVAAADTLDYQPQLQPKSYNSKDSFRGTGISLLPIH